MLAKGDYEKARQKDPQNHKINEEIKKIDRLIRQASRKDYYKILGVAKTTSKRDIKKAYRKKAMEYHPDRYTGSKEQAQKKMADINQAWEVLGDDAKRKQFDDGVDPFDPMGGQEGHPGGHPFFFTQGSSNPFHNFFQQGGGGNFHFSFQ
jgi:DnaJ family protein C protein 3